MAGSLNFEAVPIGALHSSLNAPPWGTALYARSSALVPDPPFVWTIHSTADPEVVPFEEMTGALDPNPKASLELAARLNDTFPEPSTTRWNTFNTPLVPPACPAPGEAVGR